MVLWKAVREDWGEKIRLEINDDGKTWYKLILDSMLFVVFAKRAIE